MAPKEQFPDGLHLSQSWAWAAEACPPKHGHFIKPLIKKCLLLMNLRPTEKPLFDCRFAVHRVAFGALFKRLRQHLQIHPQTSCRHLGCRGLRLFRNLKRLR